MRPAKILQVITRLIVGGAQETVLLTAAGLPPERFQVEALCGPQTGSEGSLFEEARQLGVNIEQLRHLRREINPWRDLLALFGLIRRMRAGRYDLVHTHSSKAGILGRWAARLAGVPLIVHTVHGWSFHTGMSQREQQLFIRLERWAAKLSDALVVVAGPDREKGLEAGIGRPEQYHLIRSGLPVQDFDPQAQDSLAIRLALGLPAEVPVLGNVGRFSWQKDPLEWVSVASRVARALPECRFLLVGDGPLRPQVLSALQASGLAEKTVLAGLRREVASMLSAMDVFLLTSRWEGLPRVLPQAMLMERPVVAYAVDGCAEVIQDGLNGYAVTPGDQEAASARCIELLQDGQRRRKSGAYGREYAAQEFNLERMLRQTEQLYTDLLAHKLPGRGSDG